MINFGPGIRHAEEQKFRENILRALTDIGRTQQEIILRLDRAEPVQKPEPVQKQEKKAAK